MSKDTAPSVGILLLAIVLVTAFVAWLFMISLGGAGVSVGFIPMWGLVIATRLLVGNSTVN